MNLLDSAIAGAVITTVGALAVGLIAALVTLVGYRSFGEERSLSVAASVFDARLAAYAKLWSTVQVRGEEDDPKLIDAADASRTADWLTEWYFEGGNGMLLSPDAQALWAQIRDGLRTIDDRKVRRSAGWAAMSLLRTELKIDLTVKEAASRNARAKRRRTAVHSNRLTHLRGEAKALFDPDKAGAFTWPEARPVARRLLDRIQAS